MSRTGPAPRHDYAAVLPGMLAESAKLAAVAEQLGVAEAVVMHHARKLGLEALAPKERRRESVLAMYAAGHAVKVIALTVGCDRGTVVNLLTKAGVYRRGVGGHRRLSREDRARLRAAPP